MTEHTPTPWELFNVNGVVAIKNPRGAGSKNEIVFWSGFDASHYPKQAVANATFIVEAVNAHDALLAENEKLRKQLVRCEVALKIISSEDAGFLGQTARAALTPAPTIWTSSVSASHDSRRRVVKENTC